jgi:hypothetical protein
MNVTDERMFYRFRPTDALLDKHQELEKQEIYFSSPAEMNDPIEGFKDLFWRGDHIVWRHFLRHYLLCLMKTVTIAVIAGADYKSSMSNDWIFSTWRNLATPQMRDIYERICAEFFGSYGLSSLPDLIADSNYTFRRDDLEFILRSIHGFAISTIFDFFRKEKMIPQTAATPLASISAEETINSLKQTLKNIAKNDEGLDAKAFGALFNAAGHVFRQALLLRYLAESDESRAWHALYFSFPELYLDRVGDLLFFDWYSASFVADPSHAAMWGNYANGHKGVCLQFRAKANPGGPPTLNLYGLNGASGNKAGITMTSGPRTLTFDKVSYVENFEPIDFFRNLGRPTMINLREEWYTDASGNVSNSAGLLFTHEAQWRQQYLESFSKTMSAKLHDWRHEDEYRLTLTSALDLFSNKEDRKLTYNFADLEGIVFGIRTPLEAKERIIKIIGDKCKAEGRQSFAFSQATYSPDSGKIVVLALDLVRFQETET